MSSIEKALVKVKTLFHKKNEKGSDVINNAFRRTKMCSEKCKPIDQFLLYECSVVLDILELLVIKITGTGKSMKFSIQIDPQNYSKIEKGRNEDGCKVCFSNYDWVIEELAALIPKCKPVDIMRFNRKALKDITFKVSPGNLVERRNRIAYVAEHHGLTMDVFRSKLMNIYNFSI